MADLHATSRPHLHPGVDPQSWLGFEQRIQSRRFDALLASARAAIAEGNYLLGAHALQEAREIRPDAIELAALEVALERITPHQPRLWTRAGSAVMLLAVGVAMFVALDQTRIARGTLPVVPSPPQQELQGSSGRARTVPFAEAVAPSVTAEADEESDAPFNDESNFVPASPDTPRQNPAPVERRPENALMGVTRSASALSPPKFVVSGLPSDAAPASNRASDAEEQQDDDVAPTDTTTGPAPSVKPPVEPPLSPPISRGVAPEAVKTAAVVTDQSRIADVLRRYARAYGELDVNAARDVWPDVDQRALARAFGSLSSQSVSFDDCQIDVQGATANASCHGRASYVGKVGSGAPRSESRTWRFELRRDGESWKIEHAEARRAVASSY